MHLRATLLSTLGLTLYAGSALAVPTITFTSTPPLVTRYEADEKTTYGCPDRNSQTKSCIVDGTSQGIGYHDCVDDTVLSFSLSMTGVPDANYNLQVWAGTGDCTQAGATNNGSTGICWQVAASPQLKISLAPFFIRVADLVRYLNISPPPQTYTPTDALTACNDARSQSSTTIVTDDSGSTTSTAGETTVTIFFLVFQNGSTTPAANVSYPVKVKLAGPNPVSNVAASAGDGEVIVTWTPPSGDTTIQGFNVYAAPDGSSTSVGDGGLTTTCDASSVGTEEVDDAGNVIVDDAGNPIFFDDAGNPLGADAGCTTSGGTTTNTCSGGGGTLDVSGISCRTSGDGGVVNANGGICNQVYGTTQTKGTIAGLTNGSDYVAAVAAFDQFGNNGAVSSALCSTPKPINDFWTTYNNDGGNAFCALAVVGKRGGGIAAALVGIAGLIFVRRRRKA